MREHAPSILGDLCEVDVEVAVAMLFLLTTTSRLRFYAGRAVDLEAVVVVVFFLRLPTTTSKLAQGLRA